MRIRISLVALLLCLCAVPLWAGAPARALAWQGKGADGRTVDFDPQHLHRPALLLFWATWCPYCEALMPYLQKVYNAAGPKKLDVYAIDMKDENGHPAAVLRQRKLAFTLVRDGDAIADAYGVEGTPGLFLVDAKGDIVYARSGDDEPAKVELALRAKLHLGKARRR